MKKERVEEDIQENEVRCGAAQQARPAVLGRYVTPHPCCVCPTPQVRIMSVNKVRNYISYAVALLEEKGHSSVVLKAMGQAINKAVVVGECETAACLTYAQRGTAWQLHPDPGSTGPVTPVLLSSPSASQRRSACAIPLPPPPTPHTHS